MLTRIINSNRSAVNSTPTRGAIVSSGVMAFAGLGDAILYPILPIYADSLNIPIIWVGLMLSINRLVRIISNTWIANIINRVGMKKMMILSAFLSVFTTISYGLKFGVPVFLFARIIWGLSYSSLKSATLSYAALVPQQQGLIFGITKSIYSFGAFAALWFGPILIRSIGVSSGLIAIGSIGAVGVLLALVLPDIKQQSGKITSAKTFSASPINLLVFILSVSIDGIMVVTLSNLLGGHHVDPEDLLAAVGFYLLLKRLFMVGISLLGGMISLIIAPAKMFQVSIILCLAGLLLIALNYSIPGIIIAFLFNAVVVTFSPLIALSPDKESHLQSISGISTWWDLGAGIGAFLGIILLEQLGQQFLFFVLTLSIGVIFTNFIFQNAKANRTTL